MGIKSFDWKLNATNPATVRNDISATLKLYFQNFNDLLRKRDGVIIEPDHTGRQVNTSSREYSYEELLIRQPMETQAKETQNPQGEKIDAPTTGEKGCNPLLLTYDPQYYEIKIVVGWAYDPNIYTTIRPALKRALANQKLILFLTLVEHKFDFTQEGTFSLEVSYRGRLEALASDPRTDVLMNPKSKVKMAQLEDELMEERAKCASTKNAKEIQEAAITSKEDEISQERDQFRDDLLKALISGIEDKIYIWSQNRESLATARPATKSGAFQRQYNINRDIMISSDQIKKMLDAVKTNLLKPEETYGDKSFEALRQQMIGNVKELEDKDPEDAAASEGKTDTDGNPEGEVPVVVGDMIHVPWFYLGDLINEAVIHAFSEETTAGSGGFSKDAVNKIRFILGPISLKTITRRKVGDVGASGKTRQVEGAAVGKTAEADKTEIHHMCLGDIPITLQTFKEWYAERVINAQRGSYPLLDFVRDIVNDLALVGVRSVCEELGIVQDIRIKTAQISLPGLQQGSDYLDPLREIIKETNTKEGGRDEKSVWNCHLDLDPLTKSQFNKIQMPDGVNPDQVTLENSYHYFVIYGENADSNVLTGDFSEDRKKGIYHLYLGARTGLVKEVNFQMNNAAYLREARFQQDSLNPLSQLAATYNCNLKLVGNTIFWPGQYIFVNPIGFGTGLGDPSSRGSVSNQLGLGGYHLITKVNSFIEEGKFETDVTALFEASGDGCPRTPNQIDKGTCPKKGKSPSTGGGTAPKSGIDTPSSTSKSGGTPPKGHGGGCFLGNASITMADNSVKRIEDIGKGDEILAVDLATGHHKAAPVLELLDYEPIERSFILLNGFPTTGEHPFLTERGWHCAFNLQIGDQLITKSGYTEVTSLQTTHLAIKHYNLILDGADSFIVDNYVVMSHSDLFDAVWESEKNILKSKLSSRINMEPPTITSRGIFNA